MWKFALVLAVVHGASCLAPSTHWVLETLKCSEHRVTVSGNKNLAETPEDLDQMCKKQGEFYSCLEKLVSLMEPASMSESASEFSSEKSVFNSLCSPDSPWRSRYLEFAPCINMQQTDFCRTPEFLAAHGTALTPYLNTEEKIEICITATLTVRCGIEAGELFLHLLELKDDDVGQSVETTYTDSDPSSNENHSTENAFGEIYDPLVKKIGYIPEKDSEESFVLHKRVGHMHEESESADENEAGLLEIEDSNPYSHFMEFEDDSEDVEHAVSEDNDSVTEVATSTSDTVDDETSDGSPEKTGIFAILDQYDIKLQDIFDKKKILMARGPRTLPSIIKDRIKIVHILNPEENYETIRKAREVNTLPSIIKDRFRSARTLNPEEKYETVRIFPDGRINYYSRRRDIQGLETIKCYNFPDYFVCINMPRSEYPRCLKTTVFTGPREGEFFPEEFDPEFGAQWYETIPKEAYLFEPWVHQSVEDESDQLSYTSAYITESAQASYVPVDNRGAEDGVELLEDVDADTHIVSKHALSFNIMKDSDAYEFTTKENKAETIMHIFKHFTAALPSTSKIEIKNLIQENVVEALGNLYESKRVSFENVKIRLDNSGNLYIFWNNQQESEIDTITCGKVNECHPKGEGIWKCVIVPRPPIDTDGLEI